MSSNNVLPTAPEYAETEQQLYPINEIAMQKTSVSRKSLIYKQS